jgi:hypothetical protein
MDQVFLNIDWDTIIPGLVGGLVAGACTLSAILIQHRVDLEREEAKEKVLICGFVQAVLAEIHTLWDAYYESAGKKIELLEKGRPFMDYYPISEDYFSVYSANSFLVGRIHDPRLRKAIVESYTKARWLIDSYRLNNDMVQKFYHIDLMRQDGGGVGLGNMMWMQEQALIQNAPKLLDFHRQTKVSIEHLFMIAKKDALAK